MLEGTIKEFEISSSELPKRHENFYYNLSVDIRKGIVADILLDEWFFLQEKSWLISKIKKPFTYFVKAGSVCVEFGERTLDSAIRRTLRQDPNHILTKADRLRAFSKWIAVGGTHMVLSITNPSGKSLTIADNLSVGIPNNEFLSGA